MGYMFSFKGNTEEMNLFEEAQWAKGAKDMSALLLLYEVKPNGA